MTVSTKATLLVSAIAVFQVTWHIALGLENTCTSALRHAYLAALGTAVVNGASHPKPAVAALADLVFPAFIAGAALAFGRIVSTRSRVLFCFIVGVLLTILQFIYPLTTTYDMWWLVPERIGRPTVLLGNVLFGTAFCYVGTWIGDEWAKRRKQNGNLEDTGREGQR